MSTKDFLKKIKDEDIEYVDVRFTDTRGKLQHVTIVSDLVDEDFIEEGFMFDGSSIAGWKSIEHGHRLCGPFLCRKNDLRALLYR